MYINPRFPGNIFKDQCGKCQVFVHRKQDAKSHVNQASFLGNISKFFRNGSLCMGKIRHS